MPSNTRWQRTPIRNEADWIPRTIDELEHVRAALTDAGHPATVVNGLTGWLVAKALGEVDNTSGKTRASYRKILRELGDPPTRTGRRLRSVGGDSGDVDRGTLVGAGLVGAAGMSLTMGSPWAALAAVLVLAAHNAGPEDYVELGVELEESLAA